MQQVDGVDDGNHRVEYRHVGQAFSLFRAEVEGRSYRKWFGNAGRLDQQVIEPLTLGQRAYFLQQIVAQRAADAAVGHLHQLFVSPREVRTAISHQVGIDVHLAHVVHNHRHLQALAIVEHVIQQSCLSSPKEAGQDGDGEFSHGDQKASSTRAAPTWNEDACWDPSMADERYVIT